MTPLRMTALAAMAAASLNAAQASDITVGMITTLSGGGAGLGVDVRDGFQLALDMAGEHAIKLVVEDDAQRPELAVQIAERMIQSERADILTGIIWSNLAMAVVPSTVAQDIFYLSPNAGPSALAGANCHPNYFNVAWQTAPEGRSVFYHHESLRNQGIESIQNRQSCRFSRSHHSCI
jgi:branched-chain amino acid transport system substrate-binding protein